MRALVCLSSPDEQAAIERVFQQFLQITLGDFTSRLPIDSLSHTRQRIVPCGIQFKQPLGNGGFIGINLNRVLQFIVGNRPANPSSTTEGLESYSPAEEHDVRGARAC